MSYDLKPLFTWRSAVADKESGLTPTQRHIALTLSLHMSERGDSCFPSVATLCDETGLSKRAVIDNLRSLAKGGWIRVRARNTRDGQAVGGRGHKNEYMATVPVKTVNEAHRSNGNGEAPSKSDDERVNVVPGKGEPAAPEDVKQDVTPEDGEPSPSDASSPSWDGFEDIEKLLRELRWKDRPLAETDLFDPVFWAQIDATTKGSSVYYDDELRQYAVWLNFQPSSFRRTNHRRGFSNWVKKAIAQVGWAERRRTRAKAG